jgi:hypothetical protein
VDNYAAERWMAPFPNLDIRHDKNLTLTRWSPENFRDKKACQGWNLLAPTDSIPGWGVTKGRFDQFLKELEEKLCQP